MSPLSARNKIDRGFTLIELLVVIAIIALLSAVILSSLNSSRARGRLAAAYQTMESLQRQASLCDIGGSGGTPTGQLVAPAFNQTGGGNNFCNPAGNLGTWLTLPAGWAYSAETDVTPGDGIFSFTATGDGFTITCTQSGCVKS